MEKFIFPKCKDHFQIPFIGFIGNSFDDGAMANGSVPTKKHNGNLYASMETSKYIYISFLASLVGHARSTSTTRLFCIARAAS
jgi:hypothetical protein